MRSRRAKETASIELPVSEVVPVAIGAQPLAQGDERRELRTQSTARSADHVAALDKALAAIASRQTLLRRSVLNEFR
jgi:hypothetical protein